MNISKGFTIIELAVVIIIIAVLAAIILVYVSQFLLKGRDSAIRANMATLLTNGSTYYAGHSGNYLGFDIDTKGCSDYGPIYKAIAKAKGNLFCKLKNDGSAWCACSKLLLSANNAPLYFCVDSTGAKKETQISCEDASAPCRSGANEGYCH